MFTAIISLILMLIFMALSGFHFYWFFGGKWGGDSVFPTKGEKAGPPPIPKFATLIVALGLAGIALLYLIKSGIIAVHLPNWIAYAYWIIPIIFTLRAIGEFNYVGFFKKVKGTKFANADSKLFSPLCLVIGVLGVLINLV